MTKLEDMRARISLALQAVGMSKAYGDAASVVIADDQAGEAGDLPAWQSPDFEGGETWAEKIAEDARRKMRARVMDAIQGRDGEFPTLADELKAAKDNRDAANEMADEERQRADRAASLLAKAEERARLAEVEADKARSMADEVRAELKREQARASDLRRRLGNRVTLHRLEREHSVKLRDAIDAAIFWLEAERKTTPAMTPPVEILRTLRAAKKAGR